MSSILVLAVFRHHQAAEDLGLPGAWLERVLWLETS
jgi:hypothetical protein